jgi:hypothetical protein
MTGALYDWYPDAPYQFPRTERFPVVRITVAGPAPFNTLVIVRAVVPVIPHNHPADGHIRRNTIILATEFSLVGHDPRTGKPAARHSTTACLQMIQADDDTAFLAAVDTVTGDFDEQGRWIITAQVADSADDVIYGAQAYASSWVLCYEPPIETHNHPVTPQQIGLGPRPGYAPLDLARPHATSSGPDSHDEGTFAGTAPTTQFGTRTASPRHPPHGCDQANN